MLINGMLTIYCIVVVFVIRSFYLNVRKTEFDVCQILIFIKDVRKHVLDYFTVIGKMKYVILAILGKGNRKFFFFN